MGLLTKVAVVGAAYSFAKSEQGRRVIAEARQRFDTPANREKARQGIVQAADLAKRQLQNRRAPG